MVSTGFIKNRIFIVSLFILVINSNLFARVLPEGSKPFCFGLELGPNIVDFDSIPKSFLPSGRNSTTGSLLSFWFILGGRIDNIHLLGRLGITGSSGIGLEESDSINMGGLALISFIATSKLYRYNRLSLDGLIGYQYSAFDAYTSENQDSIFMIKAWGPVVGVSPKFMLKKLNPDIPKERGLKIFDNLQIGFGYEYTHSKHPINHFILMFGSEFKDGHAYFRFRYIHQKNVCKVYVLSLGGLGFFGF